MIAFLHNGLTYILPFLFVLTVLVFVHEFGHYFIARRNGVRVDVFSIGFGPELFGWYDRAGTRWKSKLRYGGHVQAFSEDDYRTLSGRCSLPVTRVRWSYHHFFSLIDVLYFSFLELRGGARTSVEDFVTARRGWSAAPMRLAWGVVSSMGWYEARAFRWMPGACGHFTCIRQG